MITNYYFIQLQSRNGEDMMEEWGEWLGEESEEGVPDIQSRLDAATLEEKDRGWTADDMKLVNPSICLVKVCEISSLIPRPSSPPHKIL